MIRSDLPEHPIMQILELPGPGDERAPTVREGVPCIHPFFIAAQFHPELTSRPLRPQPIFMGLIAAALQRKYPKIDVPKWSRAGVG